jgi:DNA-binding NarL/FixJ family response regulator
MLRVFSFGRFCREGDWRGGVAMERMMIVEDHSAFAQALRLVLGEGTQISLARTLEEGRALIGAAEPFDVVVLDLSLPDGEGTELVPEIRGRDPQTRVVVLSAREDAGEVASEAGVDAAILKETPLPEIVSFLKRLTG